MKTINRNSVMAVALFLLLWTVPPVSAFYAPQSQRWVTRDPLGDQGSLSVLRVHVRGYFQIVERDREPSLYVFARNDAENRFDLDGRTWAAWLIRICGGSSAAGPATLVCTLVSENIYKSPSGKPVQKACNYECRGGAGHGSSDMLETYRPRSGTINLPPDQPCPDPKDPKVGKAADDWPVVIGEFNIPPPIAH